MFPALSFGQTPISKLHEYVKEFPRGRYTYKNIADKLVVNAKDDLDKAKLIYLWIAENIDYDVKAFNSGNFPDGSPEKTLKRKKAVCDGYARLYNAMASHLGLQVEMVNGFSKNSEKAKVSRESDHSWNSIKIGDENILLDVTWGAGATMNNKFISKTNYYYFNTDPNEFIFQHLPDSIKYQNIDAPVSKEEFKKMPYINKEIFINKLISGNEVLRKFRTGIKTSFPSFYSSDIEYNIIKAPIEMKSRETYDFVIDSKNAFGIEVFNKKNKSIKKLEMSKKGIYYFTINPEKKDIFKIGLIDSIDKSKSSTSTSYTYIFSYEIK